ncbi:hypothetical protein AU476_33410 [Cupriavidus sp. UYMSc13B]|nr:hypothetical protein AU476_33410 [Cupriavidus sp. UYMSc13B]
MCDFAQWFERQRHNFRDIDGHQAFEEIGGVITAAAYGVLERDAYLALGVRQSIFASDVRGRIYDLFEKYRAWLADSGLYDLNLAAQAWQPLASASYDFIVIDRGPVRPPPAEMHP